MEQVFLNLLSNAKHAVDEKSMLTDDLDYRKSIVISSMQEDNNVAVVIHDNGIGIPEKLIPNIFDPFFTTKDVETGTGLGLSISYGIIKEMKGEISVDSREGHYTKVKIELPKSIANSKN